MSKIAEPKTDSKLSKSDSAPGPKAPAPKKESKWEAFRGFLYDPKKKAFCGRTCTQWLRVLIFYTIFYAFVFGLLVGMILTVKNGFLEEERPNFYGPKSILGSVEPCLFVLAPTQNNKVGGQVANSYDPFNEIVPDTDFKNLLTAFLDKYKEKVDFSNKTCGLKKKTAVFLQDNGNDDDNSTDSITGHTDSITGHTDSSTGHTVGNTGDSGNECTVASSTACSSAASSHSPSTPSGTLHQVDAEMCQIALNNTSEDYGFGKCSCLGALSNCTFGYDENEPAPCVAIALTRIFGVTLEREGYNYTDNYVKLHCKPKDTVAVKVYPKKGMPRSNFLFTHKMHKQPFFMVKLWMKNQTNTISLNCSLNIERYYHNGTETIVKEEPVAKWLELKFKQKI